MINKFLEAIKNSKNIAIISHINPDGDAIGSSMMLNEFLSVNFPDKKKNLFAECNKLSEELSIMLKNTSFNQNEDKYYDLVICVDCGEKNRLGKYQPLFDNAKCTVNIDHHSSNDSYAEINFVDLLSSNCENLYNVLKSCNLKLTTKFANYCYAGLLTDTNSLTNNNVTGKTYQTVAELIDLGADCLNVRKVIFSGNQNNKFRLMAKAMQKCEFLVDEKLMFVELSEKEFEECGVEEEDTHGLVSQLFTLKTALAIALVTPRYGLKHVSLRSKQGVDVSAIASNFGGGGHICASAFNTELDIAKIKLELIKQFEEQFKNYKENPINVF